MDHQPQNAPAPASRRPFAADAVAIAAVVAVACLGPDVRRSASLPPFLAYLFGPGRHWLLGLAVVALSVSLVARSARLRRLASRVSVAVEARHALGWLFFAALVGVAVGRVPDLRWNLVNIGGDEPKYLRVALSLVNDTDVDVSGGRETAPDFRLRLTQLRSLALEARDAVVEVVLPRPIPPQHSWDAGNWAVHGRHGGIYQLQPPGMPALLAVFVGFGQALLPDRATGFFAAVFLVCVWILGAFETYLLARDVLVARTAALLATALLFATAPVFVGGYHLYPESVTLFLVPFCYRRLRGCQRSPGPGAIAAGLAAGGLWWLHPKFVAVSLVLVAIGLLRPRSSARARLWLAGSFLLMAGSFLVHVHYVTGLFRPEGLYIRQAQLYMGIPSVVSRAFAQGLANGLFGPRDGVFVLAPLLLLGVAALPAAMASERRTSLELGALFAAGWLTAAVHGGVSLGSPARLLVPVAFAPVLVLGLAVRRVGPRPRLLVPALFLCAVSIAVTARTASHWRLALNPYRGLFASEQDDFRRSLPSREASRAAAASDAVRTLLILAAALTLGVRWTRGATPDTGAGVEALCLLVLIAALAFALDAAGPALFGRGP